MLDSLLKGMMDAQTAGEVRFMKCLLFEFFH